MTLEEFEIAFQELTGNPPFPWQVELFRLMQAGTDSIPRRCDIPTGLGKTSVLAVWLVARKAKAEIPRRLVYVVNRRTVVDQTTFEAEKYKKIYPDLRISTLRGQFADNREWSADPSREAVVCGTVDMIGSRLLFSGYGVGFKGKPLHAGFLGQDSLIVHDEAHLEPAFQDLLVAIQKEQRRGRFPDRFPMRVMELSATSRSETGDETTEKPLTITSEDRANGTVRKRIHATKKLHLVEQTDAKPGAQLGKLAIDQFKDSGRAILIFTRTIDDVKAITDGLDRAKLKSALLIGPMRGLERDSLTDPRSNDGSPIFARFLPPPKADAPEPERWKVTPAEGTVFLVCTSAGEVGVNISADHLVCDLSTFESMAQRFGRVNRFGSRDDSEIHLVHPISSQEKARRLEAASKDEKEKIKKLASFDLENKLDVRRELTLALLEQLNGNVSPDALSKLSELDRISAFAPTPTIFEPSDILFDAWGMTSIRDKMPGRPPVEPYLHGIRDYEPPETQVAWREEVGVIVGDLLDEYPPEDLLDEYPLKPHELLGDTSKRVRDELVKLANRYGHRPVWLVDQQGKVDQLERLSEVTEMESKPGIARIERKTILLPHDVGGLTLPGLLDGSHPPAPKKDESLKPINNDIADVLKTVRQGIEKPLRMRLRDDDPGFDKKTEGYRHILCIDFPPSENDEDARPPSWHWFELPQIKENSKNATKPVLLDDHVNDVVDRVTEILSRLTLDPDSATDTKIKQAIILAARFHDLGKQREQWQRSIGRPLRFGETDPVTWFGKSGRRWKPRDITAYRHEFGSLVDLQSQPKFQSLDDDCLKDLVQHLIAAHHGQGRPHFTAEQCIDPNHRIVDCEPLTVEVPRRFARLQRKFGRWGLAYIESLLRAADYAASAAPSKFYDEAGR